MASKWNILRLGTKIRLKGKLREDDKDGIITWYLTDENKEIAGYAVKPIGNSLFMMFVAPDDEIEVLKQMTVECPWCKQPFLIEIENKYKVAEAIPPEGNLPKEEGFIQSCPNCPHELFIRCVP